MILLKAAPVLLLALTVAAEKKIELTDIEEDNLKSEKESQLQNFEAQAKSSGSPSVNPLDFLKNGLFRYFEAATPGSQQTRYVQQYAVSEPPEKPPTAAPRPQYGPPTGPQQAMVGYMSNLPMQIYLVPQYYNEQEQPTNSHSSVQYTAPASVPQIPSAPGPLHTHTNYIEVPTYVTPTGKAYLPQYPTQVAFVSYAQPTPTPQATISPVLYQQVQPYPTTIAAPPVESKNYYRYETNSIDDGPRSPTYSTQAELPYVKPSGPDYPRYYNSRVPIREEYKHGPSSELPPPNPLLIKPSPPHLSHLPKALPMYRPSTKPVYASSGSLISNAYTPRPNEAYGVPSYKRRPMSLLDSYVPSGIQIEYLKRGHSPVQVYEALSNNRNYPHAHGFPRYYERGFLPNQMYHTAHGGITYGHYKRTPKLEKIVKK